jgi:hypothetical protein
MLQPAPPLLQTHTYTPHQAQTAGNMGTHKALHFANNHKGP